MRHTQAPPLAFGGVTINGRIGHHIGAGVWGPGQSPMGYNSPTLKGGAPRVIWATPHPLPARHPGYTGAPSQRVGGHIRAGTAGGAPRHKVGRVALTPAALRQLSWGKGNGGPGGGSQLVNPALATQSQPNTGPPTPPWTPAGHVGSPTTRFAMWARDGFEGPTACPGAGGT